MRRRLRIAAFVALGLAGAVFVGVPIAWALDMRAHNGEVARNVVLGGVNVSGLTRAEVAAVVDELARRYETAEIEVDAPNGDVRFTAEDVGLQVDVAATLQDVLDTGRDGSAMGNLASWVNGYRNDRDAKVQITLDEGAVYEVIDERDDGPREPPVEPTVELDGSTFVAVDGNPGKGIDPADVIAALPTAAASGLPVRVEVPRGRVEPRFALADAKALAERAGPLTSRSVELKAGSASATVKVAQLRSWVTADARREGLVLALDGEEAMSDLRDLLPKAGKPAVETRFEVVGGQVKIIAGESGSACCGDDALTRIEQRLFGNGSGGAGVGTTSSSPILLPLQVVEPKLTTAEAERLGVKELVGSFETKHKAGEPRVANIHRIADLVRGHVILPGETFSVNTFVGKRTTAKGFVAAPVIEDGKFSEDIGGGISQFATTLFNAAFFAGLDFGEYQSHSIYISRYPYGREATLSYPHPDLEIENKTKYGVLIWPTYSSTTITVNLYSTKHLEATQTGQSSSPKGACARVKTERSVKNLETGTTKTDAIFATYRPAEGINC